MSAVSEQVQSASVCVNTDQVTVQSSWYKLSFEKKTNSCVFISGTRILHEKRALRHSIYFEIAIAQRTHEAMHVAFPIHKICSSETCLFSLRSLNICLQVGEWLKNVGYYFNHAKEGLVGW